MSYIVNKAIKCYFDELLQINLMERDVKSLTKDGNILTIESALDNKLFITSIKKEINYAKEI